MNGELTTLEIQRWRHAGLFMHQQVFGTRVQRIKDEDGPLHAVVLINNELGPGRGHQLSAIERRPRGACKA